MDKKKSFTFIGELLIIIGIVVYFFYGSIAIINKPGSILGILTILIGAMFLFLRDRTIRKA